MRKEAAPVDLLSPALESLDAGVALADVDARIVWANPFFRRLAGGAAAGKRLDELPEGLRATIERTPVRDSDGAITHWWLRAHDSPTPRATPDTAYEHFARIADLVEEHVYAGEMRDDQRYVETFTGPGFERMMGQALRPGVSAEEIWESSVHPDDVAAYTAHDARLAAGEPAELRYRVIWPDGQVRMLRERVWPRRLEDGRLWVEGVVSDVTERELLARQLAETQATLRRIVEAVDEHVYTVAVEDDGTQSLIYCGPGRERLLGCSPPPDADADADWQAAVHPDDRATVAALVAAMARGEPLDLEYRLVGSDGVVRWVWDRNRPRRDADGRLLFDGIVSEITDRRRAADELAAARDEAERRSRHDHLTGVFNRDHFGTLLASALERTEPGGPPPGVLVLDADRFKQINDTFGHHAGDDVLVGVAQRLLQAVGPAGFVGRWGGEEFVALLPAVSGDDQLRAVAERVRHALGSEPLSTGAGPISLTVSVGGVVTGPPLDTPERVLRAADQALYAAKRAGRDRVVLHGDVSESELVSGEPDAVHLARTLALAASVREGMPPLHAEQVADLSAKVALRLGLPPVTILRCRLAGWLHDVGKVAIPDHVLGKPEKLDASEWELMRLHPSIGAQLVRRIPSLADAAPAVLHHHERVDGRGYPDELAGDAIPIEARVVAAVDAYSAMTMPRVYKPARDRRLAIAELRRSAGTHLDVRVVEALCATLASELTALQTRLQLGEAAA